MAINAFGLETMTLGRMTMPRFAESKRAGDLALGAENPYLDMVQKLESFLPMATGYYRAEDYNGVGWANTMYPFIAPAALFGVYAGTEGSWHSKGAKRPCATAAC